MGWGWGWGQRMLGSIEQENSVCWVHRGAACVGHRLRGTASVGVHRATACVIGDEEAVHQARRTARAGVHRTRGIGRRAACGGPIGQEEQLCCPPIGQARTHHTLFFLSNGPHAVLRVHGPTTRCSACSMDTTHAALLDGPTTSCSRLLNGPMDHRTLLQEEHVLGSIGPRTVCAGVHRGRRTACAGSTAQEEHQQGVWWVHQARRTGVGSIKVMRGGVLGVRGEVWRNGAAERTRACNGL